MKKKSSTTWTYLPTRRDDSTGQWLCNTVVDCAEPAVRQASPVTLPPCAGCSSAGAEILGSIDSRRAELDQVTAREDGILAATDGDVLDVTEMRALADRKQTLRGEIDGLQAEYDRVVAEHTHPLFACARHVTRLPQ